MRDNGIKASNMGMDTIKIKSQMRSTWDNSNKG